MQIEMVFAQSGDLVEDWWFLFVHASRKLLNNYRLPENNNDDNKEALYENSPKILCIIACPVLCLPGERAAGVRAGPAI
ncbi:MAG: hypothetical protein ACKV2V_24265 [Blastocatellia bacterium]